MRAGGPLKWTQSQKGKNTYTYYIYIGSRALQRPWPTSSFTIYQGSSHARQLLTGLNHCWLGEKKTEDHCYLPVRYIPHGSGLGPVALLVNKQSKCVTSPSWEMQIASRNPLPLLLPLPRAKPSVTTAQHNTLTLISPYAPFFLDQQTTEPQLGPGT